MQYFGNFMMPVERLSVTWRARGKYAAEYLIIPDKKLLELLELLPVLPKRKWQSFMRYTILELAEMIVNGTIDYNRLGVLRPARYILEESESKFGIFFSKGLVCTQFFDEKVVFCYPKI